MVKETYRLRLENLTPLLKQAPTPQNVMQYLEARIALLEEYLGLHLQAEQPQQQPSPAKKV